MACLFPGMRPDLEKLSNWLYAHRRRGFHPGLALTVIILLAWFLVNVASPYLAPAGTVLGEDGKVGVRDNSAVISRIDNGLARFFYNAGDANCHQHASRSFFLNGNQMPFCTRCTAIFLGLVLGVLIMMFLDIELNILWIILGLVPIGLDGGMQLVTNYESTNGIRFVTGLLAGIVTGIALGFIVSELGTIAVYRKKGKLKKK